MAKLEIRKSEVDRLRPSPRAITDGSLDPVPVKAGVGSDTLVLYVDRVSARRYALNRRMKVVLAIGVLAVSLTIGILYGRNDPLIAGNPDRWGLLSVTVPWLIAAVYLSYLTPRIRPRTWRQSDTVRLHGVDDTAAAAWQAANNAGVITVKPDTPTRDMLVRHLPPIMFGLVVVAVALLA